MTTGKPSPFVFEEGAPQLRSPHVLACLTPWVDVGSVGSSTLQDLERHLNAKPLAKLVKPGMFFDFTRYRPTSFFKNGEREIELPNTVLRYAVADGDNDHDFIFMHVLEPHAHGEDYVDAMLQVLLNLGVKRYLQVGAMYDVVPHSRPLLVSGQSSDPETHKRLEERFGVRRSRYEGPTSIMTTLSRDATARGIEYVSMLARLPQYAPVEEDLAGKLKMLEALTDLYGFILDLGDLRERAEQQRTQMNQAVEQNPQLRRAVEQLEARYDARHARRMSPQETPGGESTEPVLPPAIERFLRELGENTPS
jgi:predicted ATP-grasp superfamily ATP-dependent carboligase